MRANLFLLASTAATQTTTGVQATGATQSFVALVERASLVSNPCNMPLIHPTHYANGDFHDNQTAPGRSYCTAPWDDYWNDGNMHSVVTMRHLPFFTGCHGALADAHGNLPVDRVFDNEMCNIVPPEDEVIMGLGDGPFGPTPHATSCDYAVTCTYVHQPHVYTGKPYWAQLDTGNVVFFLSQDQYNPTSVTASSPSSWPTTDEELVRFEERLRQILRTAYSDFRRELFTFVRIRTDYGEHGNRDQACNALSEIDVLRTAGNHRNQPSCYPRNVTLEVKYWARQDGSTRSDRIVHGDLVLSDWAWMRFNETERPTYTLRIKYQTASWREVLNLFALPPPFYLLFFVAIGLVLVLAIALIWAFVRSGARVSSRRRAPGLRLIKFLRLYMMPSTCAATAVWTAVMLGLMTVRYLFIEYNPGWQVPCSYSYMGRAESLLSPRVPPGMSIPEMQAMCRDSRVGLIFFILGLHLLYDTIRLWVPTASAPRNEVGKLRLDLITNTAVYVGMLIFACEFVFSHVFGLNPLLFWFLFKMLCICIEMRIARHAGNIVFFPQVMLLEIASLMMTGWLGAEDFLSFISAQILELSMNVFRRVVIEPTKGRVLHAQHVGGSINRATKQSTAPAPLVDSSSDATGLALPNLPVPKEVAQAAFNQAPRMTVSAASNDAHGEADLPAGLRHTLVIWCTDTAALYIEITMAIMMFLFKDEFEINKLFGRRSTDMMYFMLFLVFLVPASWVEDAFTNNINEIIYGWDATAYMERQATRYARRGRLWALGAPAADERLYPWERIDRVLMTDQMWLLLMMYGAGGAICMLGYILMLHQNYNMCHDLLFLPFIATTSLCYKLFAMLCVRFFRYFFQPRAPAPGVRGTWRV